MNKNIQALRGICAIMVFLSHSLHVNDIEWVSVLHNSPFHLFFDGGVAVSVFFVISGFFYYKDASFSKENYFRSISRKISKIYPPHIIFLTLGVVILSIFQQYGINDYSGASQWFAGFWQKKVTVLDFLKSCTVVLPNDTNLINPPVWYLMAEVTMFLVMPILVPSLNRIGWGFSLIIIILCMIIKVPLIPWVGYYLVGALFHRYDRIIMRFIDSNKLTLWCAILIGIVLLNIENEITIDNRTTAMLSCVGAGIIILVLFNKRVDIYELEGLQFLGNISYEFYLCHFIVLLSLRPFISNAYWLLFFAAFVSVLLAKLVNKMKLGSFITTI